MDFVVRCPILLILLAGLNPCSGELLVVNELKTWWEADAFCRENDGRHLVSVADRVQNNALRLLLPQKERFWIGFSDQRFEGQWEWSDGSEISYTNWGGNNPTDYPTRNEDCGEMGRNGRWNSRVCTALRPFICSSPQGAPTINPFTDTLMFVDTPMSWSAAQEYCQLHDGRNLVTIQGDRQNAELRAFVPDKEKFWIGLHDSVIEGHWIWADGSDFGGSYLNWGKNKPSEKPGRNEDCVEMMGQGAWNDRKCSNLRKFVCAAPRKLMLDVKCRVEAAFGLQRASPPGFPESISVGQSADFICDNGRPFRTSGQISGSFPCIRDPVSGAGVIKFPSLPMCSSADIEPEPSPNPDNQEPLSTCSTMPDPNLFLVPARIGYRINAGEFAGFSCSEGYTFTDGPPVQKFRCLPDLGGESASFNFPENPCGATSSSKTTAIVVTFLVILFLAGAGGICYWYKGEKSSGGSTSSDEYGEDEDDEDYQDYDANEGLSAFELEDRGQTASSYE